MIDRIISFVEQHRMLQQGDCVTVGLSGGADSVALLYVMRELAPRYFLTLTACHVNHQLRGEEGDGDEAFCRRLCERLGIPLSVRRIDVRTYCKANKLSIEEGARELRYRALREASAGKIATAHHADDNAETVLLNLLRGTALDGLCGIAPVRGQIIRPLLGVTRAELEDYLDRIGQDYRTDRTNLEDAQLRNRLRHHVIPLLRKENPDFSQGILRMTEGLRGDRSLLERSARELLECAALPPRRRSSVRLTGLPDSAEAASWDRQTLLAQPQPLRLRAFKLVCSGFGLDFDQERLLRLDRCLAGTGTLQLAPHWRMVVDLSRAVLLREVPLEPISPLSIDLDGPQLQEIALPCGRILCIHQIAGQEIKFFVNKSGFQFENLLDCDRMYKIIRLRSRREGDVIRLAGRRTQSLKKLMSAAAIPPFLRQGLVLLEDEQGILWAEGFGAGERAAFSEKTRRAIFLEIREETQHDAG